MANYFRKDPSAQKDYTIDFTAVLGGATISGTPTWTISPAGELAESAKSNDTTTATIEVSSGTSGKTYRLDCAVLTSSGLTLHEGIVVRVSDKP